MIRLFFLIVFLQFATVWAQTSAEFSESDPSTVHHVNVISGNLNLCFEDVNIQGPIPLPIIRTYSSAGALERSPDNVDLLLKAFRKGWMYQGGWNLLPHINLLVEPSYDRKQFKLYLPDSSGNLIAYSYSHKEGKDTIFFKAISSGYQISQLSGRFNPQNTLIRLNLEHGIATVFLANGGISVYKGVRLHKPDPSFSILKCYYLLETETLPSQHKIHYHYDCYRNLYKIETTNPSGQKVYSSISFVFSKSDATLKVSTSDHKELCYRCIPFEKRDYINDVTSNCRLSEKVQFAPGRRETGCRMTKLEIGGKEQFTVNYYAANNKKLEQRWIEKPNETPLHIDKVQSLQSSIGPNGEKITVAQFSYSPNLTEVRDSENLLTRYHHDGKKLLKIESYQKNDILFSYQQFYWKGSRLCCKAMFDEQGRTLFAKTFAYDEFGNVIEEILWGQLTGGKSSPLVINQEGAPAGGESYKKTYSYLKNFNLPLTETEEEGPSYEYKYVPGTNLLASKFTKDKDRILRREFYFYDSDNLLVHEIVDNGSGAYDANILKDVSYRLHKRYVHHASGLPEMVTESYLDLASHTEKLLKSTRIKYINNRIAEEAVYDAEGTYRYTIFTEYDRFGQVTRKTNPIGQESSYHFNEFGQPERVKEPGSSQKLYQYDKAGRQISCKELDSDHITTLSYDTKGRLLFQTDPKGNTTYHAYDCFGNRTESRFPLSQDDAGYTFEPTANFEYDIHGNLITTKMPRGETSRTSYTTLRKPTKIIQPDGHEIRHFYYKNGTLAKTIYPDSTEIHYKYDLFQRMTSKTVRSNESILSSEIWDYDAFQERSHTDPRGLTMFISYDGAGRKIAEEAEGRKLTFSYDTLGFLEKTDNGVLAKIQKHDTAGRIITQYEEDSQGRIENAIKFFYDEDNHKIKAIRLTSQGEAVDLFTYKCHKLNSHTDPQGAITQFIYDETFVNPLGQRILQKTTIDPLGNRTIEQEDACARLVLKEKKDPQGQTVFREKYLHDRSGNKTKRLSSVYLENKRMKNIEVVWEYDSMGRVIKESEAGHKITFFNYDCKGRLKEKILPSKIRWCHSYDGIDRLIKFSSSDGSVDYEYTYKGPDPIEIRDLVQNTTLTRTYNSFGQITSELNPAHIALSWNYDSQGRCSTFILPDHSSIHYAFSGAHISAIERHSSDGDLLYEHSYCQFDPNGHITEEELIHTLGSRKTTYDLLERPSIQISSWLDQTISYGPSGLVTSTKNSLFGEKYYSYDALNQLTQEGDQKYLFDSLGNCAEHHTDDCNRLISTKECSFTHDADGNPKERKTSDEIIQYNYDALGRLTEIIYPKHKKVHYLYDPVSRLYAKETYTYHRNTWKKEKKIYYLQAQDSDIGTLDENGNLIELKVLGLGIRGEIGAAIAIEILGHTYAPLHDFMGNIIALISPDETLKESYQISAFGKETLSNTPVNPWRFCSKRSEEGFVSFGLRFYDPTIGRWHTPDPAGFQDGSNLYIYVLNSPLNRLDLFGLFSEPFYAYHVDLVIPTLFFPKTNVPFHIRCFEQGVWVDYLVSCGFWHQLQFSTDEINSGKVNIMNHFSELISTKSQSIDLVTFTNGIHVSFDEFTDSCHTVIDQLPGTLFIGRHNQSEGVFKDISRACKEISGMETPKICGARQFMTACAEQIHKLNPSTLSNIGSLWLHIAHSEGGAIGRRAIEGMTPEQKSLIQQHLISLGIGPAMPTPKNYAFEAVNIYSTQDFVTGGFGAPHIPAAIVAGVVGCESAKSFWGNKDCDIRFVSCRSTWGERSFYIADHAFLGGTYQGEMKKWIGEYNKKFGFYNGKTR